eukprot:364133-Chlamydomonas_euryale.AAC.6
MRRRGGIVVTRGQGLRMRRPRNPHLRRCRHHAAADSGCAHACACTCRVCDDRPERGGAELAALLQSIPPDRLMIETDAPYLTPRTIKCVDCARLRRCGVGRDA